MANFVQNYNGGVQFKTGSSQGLTVDINGSVGIGTTPSTWTDNYKSIDLSGNGGIASTTAGYFQLANNAYVNSGGWKYKATGYSTLIQQTPTGAIQFQVATSGTTNTNITWNTAVTLDNSGNLFVGTPSQYSGSKLSIYGSGGIALADSSTVNVTSAPTIKSVGNNLVFSTDASTSPVERIRIDTNGNVGVGVIPSTWNNSQKVIQVANSSFYGYGTAGISAGTIVGQNFFYDGQARYISSGPASQTTQTNGTYIWYTAPSGIAGATTTITSGQVYTVTVLGASTLAQWQAFFSALSVLPTVGQSITATATGTLAGGGTVTQVITFNTAMTLDASGNLLTNNVVLPYNSSDAYGYKQVSSNGIWYGRVVPFSSDGAMLLESQYAANSGGFRFNVNGVQKAKIDASGNLLLTAGTGALGYGTGAGVTVAQLTSKSTAVTLNKPTGKITMTADALAAGASVTFLVNNSILTATDIVYPAIIGGIADATAYRLELVASISGMCRFRLTNLSAGSLSEAVQIQFIVIKGAIA